jgi:3-mercaptopyruvate sulfurtransferase SseA
MKTVTEKTASWPGPGPGTGVLVDPGWLARHLDDPGLRVVEVDVSPAAYGHWHVDGAVLWNVYADLKDPDYHTVGIAALERLVARSGIGPGSTVVLYGYAPALGLWLMKLYGHPRAATAWFVPTHVLGRDRVRVYDGSWAEWGRTPGMPVERP